VNTIDRPATGAGQEVNNLNINGKSALIRRISATTVDPFNPDLEAYKSDGLIRRVFELSYY